MIKARNLFNNRHSSKYLECFHMQNETWCCDFDCSQLEKLPVYDNWFLKYYYIIFIINKSYENSCDRCIRAVN